MSAYNIKWIWDQQISAVQKLVLFALNEHCNPAHGDWRCFPSKSTLVKLTGLSVRAIRQNMAELEKAGLIRVAYQYDGQRRQQSNMYWLNAPFIGAEAGSGQGAADAPGDARNARGGAADAPPGVQEMHGGRVQQMHPNLLIDKPLKSNPLSAIASDARDSASTETDSFDLFWSVYPRKAKKPEALKAWRQTAKDRPPIADLIAHLRSRAKADPQWANPKFIPHPSTFLRGHQWADAPINPGEAGPGSAAASPVARGGWK